MNRDRRISIAVGLFVMGCLALLAYAVLSLSEQRGLWAPRYRLIAYFSDVQGLIAGAPVRLAGKDVGTVEGVRFAELGAATPPIVVELSVDQEAQERIRSDSRAMVATFGFLGDKYVEVTLGSAEGAVLANGDEIATVTPVGVNALVEKGTAVLDEVTSLAANINQMVEDVGRYAIEKEVAETARGVSDLLEEIKGGRGLLHSLIYEDYEGDGVESIGRALGTLEEILTQIADGDGALHALIYEPPDDFEMVAQARQVGSHLNSILGRIDRGEGTLGLLLTDPTLYEDMKRLVDGAQRSLVVRSLIKLSGDGEGP